MDVAVATLTHELLNLGTVLLKDKERIQPRGGRLDSLTLLCTQSGSTARVFLALRTWMSLDQPCVQLCHRNDGSQGGRHIHV
jgi:hypothetical protein